MKILNIVSLGLIVLLTTTTIAWGEIKKVNPIDRTEEEDRLLLVDFSQEPTGYFRYNNYKGKITCKWSGDKTPSGMPAQHLDLKEEEAGVVNINLFYEKGGPWRDKEYETLSLWIKGDGSGIMIKISLNCGKGYIYHHRLNSEKWEKVRVPLDKLWHRKGVEAIDISKLTLFSISVSDTCSFSIGEVALEMGTKD